MVRSSMLLLFASFVASTPASGQESSLFGELGQLSVDAPAAIFSLESDNPSPDSLGLNITETVRIGMVRAELGEMVKRWMGAKHEAVGTTAGFVTGQVQNDVFGDSPAIRITVIMPSEVFRDTASEWDRFQVLATFMEQPTAGTISVRQAGNIFLSVENYSRRNRGMIAPNGIPNLDWDFTPIDDLTATNAVLKQIADQLYETAVAELVN